MSETRCDDPIDWPVRKAFDRHASHYDAWFSQNPLAVKLRGRIWEAMDRVFDPGQRVLDLGCGTGDDAVHLAGRGLRVQALDVAPAMVERLTEKARRLGLDDLIDCTVADGRSLDLPSGSLDGIYSNFGALNCVADLEWLGELGRRALRPGGRMIIIAMGRCYPLEIAVNLARGRVRPALRRFRSPASAIIRDVEFPVHYHRFRVLRKALAGGFVLEQRRGLNLLLPVPGLEHLAQRFPRTFRALQPIDSVLGRSWLFSAMGDHVLSVWKVRGS